MSERKCQSFRSKLKTSHVGHVDRFRQLFGVVLISFLPGSDEAVNASDGRDREDEVATWLHRVGLRARARLFIAT